MVENWATNQLKPWVKGRNFSEINVVANRVILNVGSEKIYTTRNNRLVSPTLKKTCVKRLDNVPASNQMTEEKKLESDHHLDARKSRTLSEFAFDDAISEYCSSCAGSCICQGETESAGGKVPRNSIDVLCFSEKSSNCEIGSRVKLPKEMFGCEMTSSILASIISRVKSLCRSFENLLTSVFCSKERSTELAKSNHWKC